jgi:hypothetical protein
MAKLNDLVAVERKGKLERVHGFLLAKSKEWLLIENEKDFQKDGYRLIPIRDVKNIRRNAADALHQNICKMFGVIPGPAPKIPFEDPERLFHALRDKSELVIIECERLGEWPYTIGKIEGIAEDQLQVAYFNVEGKFERAPRVIAFKHISQIGFGERYINGYLTYFKKKKEKRLSKWNPLQQHTGGRRRGGYH